MNVDQLRAFVQTARLGNFSAAAQAIGLSQPGVSRQVQQLERLIGVTLIDREHHPITLTPAGEEFIQCAERIVDEWETAVQRLRASSKELTGYLLVAASTIPGEFIVPELLARFKALHPQVRPSLLFTDSAGVAEELLARRVEVGFLGAPMVSHRLRLIPFAEDEILLAIPTSHPLAREQSIYLTDLADQVLVEREGGSGTLDSLKRLLSQQGLRLPSHQVGMVVGSSQAQLAAIEAGVGLGFVSSLALANRPSLNVICHQIEGLTLRRTLYMAHEHAPLSATAQAFIRMVIEGANQSVR